MLQIAVKPVLLDVFQKRSASAMNDTFRGSGRARGEHDKERLIEGKTAPGVIRGTVHAGYDVGKSLDRHFQGIGRQPIVQSDYGFQRWQLRSHFCDAIRYRDADVPRLCP